MGIKLVRGWWEERSGTYMSTVCNLKLPFFPLLFRFCHYQAFLQVVKELNDLAGQREIVAENLLTQICVELTKYSQELKQERKSVNYPLPLSDTMW